MVAGSALPSHTPEVEKVSFPIRAAVPFFLAAALGLAFIIVWPGGLHGVSIGIRLLYILVLSSTAALTCWRWQGANFSSRNILLAGVAGHLVAIGTYVANSFVVDNGLTRFANSFRDLGGRFVFVVAVFPLKYGGFAILGLTALTLLLWNRRARRQGTLGGTET